MLFLLAFIAAANAFCIAHGPYYVASKALAVGIGNYTSNAACKYVGSNSIQLNSICPDACYGLIRLTWGSCYCSQPNYAPQAGDIPFSNMTVQQIFAFFANQTPLATSMHCRDYMNLPEQKAMWQCTNKKKVLVN